MSNTNKPSRAVLCAAAAGAAAAAAGVFGLLLWRRRAAKSADAADLGRVHDAVCSNCSADELRAVIEQVARGSGARRKAAVDKRGKHPGTGEEESPLAAAARLQRTDLICVLLESGAAFELIPGCSQTALSICVLYAEPESVRKLLRAGADANEQVAPFVANAEHETEAAGLFFRPVHLCTPSSLHTQRLACLEVLAREGGADINARASPSGETALHWLAGARNYPEPDRAVDLFISLDADLEVVDVTGQTPVFNCALTGSADMLRALVSRGASLNGKDEEGLTPLIYGILRNTTPHREEMIAELVRCSSLQARRAVVADPELISLAGGVSAIDVLVCTPEGGDPPDDPSDKTFEKWHFEVISELLASDVSILPETASELLLIAAQHGQSLERELAARRSPSRRWRAHDEFVQLAFDMKDAREADERVAWREARVRELEEALGEVGGEEVAAMEEEGASVAARVKARRRGGGGRR
jgi:hypothetical protein